MSWWSDITSTKNAIRGANVRYAVYPAIDPADMSLPGVQLTSGTAKQMDAVAAAIVTAGTSPQVDYWICSVLMHTISAAKIAALELQNEATAKLADVFINPTAVTLNMPQVLDLPFPIYMAGKAVVNGILGHVDVNATAYVALLCATLL